MSRWVAEGLADPRAEMFHREGSLDGPFPIKNIYWVDGVGGSAVDDGPATVAPKYLNLASP